MDAVSADEFLGLRREDLVLADGRELALDPEDGEIERLFRIVRLSSFEDMQKLELIPRQLREDETLRAIAADDAIARQLAGTAMDGTARHTCDGCSSDGPTSRPSSRKAADPFNRAYVTVRSYHNPELARLMSDSTGTSARWNDLHVARTRKRVSVFIKFEGLMALILIAIGDLVIGKNSTVTLAPVGKGIYGNGLKIHQGGKLVIKGSGVKLRFLSAEGDIA